MVVLPEEDGPNSFDRSTRMMRMLPSTFISTFFMRAPPGPIPGPASVGRGAGVVNDPQPRNPAALDSLRSPR